MTRAEWIELRRKQGHKIEKCSICKYEVPSYLGLWWHNFIYGHDLLEILGLGDDLNASQKPST